MQITFEKDAFLRVMEAMGRVTPKVASMPILENVLFESKDGNVVVTSSDMEVMLRGRLQSKAEFEPFCMPHKLVTDFVKMSNKSFTTVEIDVNEQFIVQVKCGTAECTVAGCSGKEFPQMDTLKGTEKPVLELDAKGFVGGVSHIAWAVGNDDLRPVMMGVNLRKLDDENVKMCCTNAHVLSTYVVAGEGDVDVTIPRKVIGVIGSGIVSTDRIKVYETGRNMAAMLGEYMLYFRLVDSKYPNYEAVIPKENNIVAKVNKDVFLSSVKRSGLFSNASTGTIALRFERNALGDIFVVSSEDLDFGKSAKETLDCEVEGGDIAIGVNSKFLTACLGAIEGDVVTIRMSEPNRALLIGGEDERHESLVMPVMLA